MLNKSVTIKNVILQLVVLIAMNSCSSYSDPDEMRIQSEKVSADIKVSTTPEVLIFDRKDSIPIVFNCSYKDSAFCCGGREIRFVLDDTFNFDRIYTDSMYLYSYCGCDDTIYLKGLTIGEHYINGNTQWNSGDGTYGKNFEMQISIK